MKIMPVNIQSTCFKSKHKDIRKADDLMRKTNLAFPMFNPSYAYYFYDSIDIRNPEKHPAREKFEAGICHKFIRQVRKPNDFMEEIQTKFDIPHAYLLSLLKDKKMGNCKETAIATLCALYANGYHNSQRVSLAYEYKIIDNSTKEILLEGENDLDHSVVLTDLNLPERKKINELIVIDPWLEYAGTTTSANGKYKMQFGKLIDQDMENIAFENAIDLDKCTVKTKIYYSIEQRKSAEEARKIGNYTRQEYPELIY